MANITIPVEFLSKLTRQEQIIELNNTVKCTLKASKIHGIGVFAMRFIPKGGRCYVTPNVIPKFYTLSFGDLNKLFPEIKGLILQRWASVVNGSLFCSPNDDAHLLMFMNHSPNPEKVNYDVVSDTALRNIRENEELFEDYRVMDNWEKVRPLNKNQWLISETKNPELSILKRTERWLWPHLSK